MIISVSRVSTLLLWLIVAVVSTRFESAGGQEQELSSEQTTTTDGQDVQQDKKDSIHWGEVVDRRPEELTYGVIVDCGSSGSRAHIYQWNGDLEYPELLQKIEPMRDSKGRPVSMKEPTPLSSIEDRPGESARYFKNLMTFVSSKIPKSRHPFTGVYIMATAGMRLLDDKDQDGIMDSTKRYIVSNYDFLRVETSVISGANEGMYQWISVNAKAKRFLNKNSALKTKTYAVIEMGGASIQVTYQLRPHLGDLVLRNLPQRLRSTYLAQIVEPQMSRAQLLEHNYTLHSTTFLGFGSNSARSAYVDLLIKHQNPAWMDKIAHWTPGWLAPYLGMGASGTATSAGSGGSVIDVSSLPLMVSPEGKEYRMTLDDYCLPKGHVEYMKKPKRMLANTEQTIGFILDEDDEDMFRVKLRGRGNYLKCKKLVQKMLRTAKQERLNCKPNESCTMDLVGENFVPFNLPIRFDFLGIGDLYHSTYIMLNAAGFYNHKKIVERTRSICNMSKKKLLQLYPQVYDNERSRDRIGIQCFKAVWVDTFLTKGISMPKEYNLLKTVNKIGEDDLEWTLGAVLDKSLAIEKATEAAEQAEEQQRAAKTMP